MAKRMAAHGYGLRYEFGIVIRDGWQVERSDKWLQFGNPFEIPISDASFEVKYGGHTETWTDEARCLRWRWVPETAVKGIPYDTARSGKFSSDRTSGSTATKSGRSLFLSPGPMSKLIARPRSVLN